MGAAALYAQDLPCCASPALSLPCCSDFIPSGLRGGSYRKLLRKRQVKFCIVLKSFGSNLPLNDVLLHLEAPELCVAS